jgi:hypothetical protein
MGLRMIERRTNDSSRHIYWILKQRTHSRGDRNNETILNVPVLKSTRNKEGKQSALDLKAMHNGQRWTLLGQTKKMDNENTKDEVCGYATYSKREVVRDGSSA